MATIYDVDYLDSDSHPQLTLYSKDKPVFTLQDTELLQAVEDGLIDLDRLLDSALWYARHFCLI